MAFVNRTAAVLALKRRYAEREQNNLPTGGECFPSPAQQQLLERLGGDPSDYAVGFPSWKEVRAYVDNRVNWSRTFKETIHSTGPATCMLSPL